MNLFKANFLSIGKELHHDGLIFFHRSIKHYFLLDKGDFIVQFMDMTEDEMKLEIEEIMPTRLESLLELALRTSTANVDPYKDDLK